MEFDGNVVVRLIPKFSEVDSKWIVLKASDDKVDDDVLFEFILVGNAEVSQSVEIEDGLHIIADKAHYWCRVLI